jgi:dTDP-glucose 4,6-dehydratase
LLTIVPWLFLFTRECGVPKNSILITGAGGFIGSHLAEAAVVAGYPVRALLRYNSRGNWGWLEACSVRSEVEVVFGDVRDYDSTFAAVRGCVAVFHLAALIGIPYSYLSPIAYVRTNVEGTYNVLEASRQSGVENVIITSTSETYGSAQRIPIDEEHPAAAQSPYAATKVAADQLAMSYWRSFDVPVKIVRPFNTFGPRQSARAIIPSLISQIASGEREIRVGNLCPTRDFTYVLDTVQAFLAVASCDACRGTVVNVGSNREISIRDLADEIASLMAAEITLCEESERVRPASSEVDRLRCDNSRIQALTGWRPQWDVRRGLKETIQWVESNQAQYKPDLYAI